MLDLCIFAEASRSEQEVFVVGCLGKVEALVSEQIVRIGRRSDRCGSVRTESITDPDIRHVERHHGAPYLEHVALFDTILFASEPTVTLRERLASVTVGAHRSIEDEPYVGLDEVLG